MTIGIYGRRVIGDEAAKREKVIVKKMANIYGRRVAGITDDEPAGNATGSTASAPSEAETGATADGNAGEGEGVVASAAGADGFLSTRELDAAVRANPALVDGFFAHELTREPFPRATALRSLLAAETSDAGLKRPEVVAQIEDEIAKLQSKGD